MTDVRLMTIITIVFILMGVVIQLVVSWHGLDNKNFHCWPLHASPSNPQPFPSCPGVLIRWVEPPPDAIKAQEAFNTTYELRLNLTFYRWAVGLTPNVFLKANGSGLSDPLEAMAWCERTPCTDVVRADEATCCIHHVNVHSCPLSETTIVVGELCGPWIPAKGNIFTHSEVMVGSAARRRWTSSVSGLYKTGLSAVIGHFKVAGMHIVVEKKVKVLARAVCGNEDCEEEEESCFTCQKDCGICPTPAKQSIIIGTTTSVAILVTLGIVAYFRWHRQKQLWDDSWIVLFEDICSASTTCFESVGTNPNRSETSLGSRTSQVTNDSFKSQKFTTTAVCKGKWVAVKMVRKNEFVLTRAIRLEVREMRELDHPNLCRFVGGCIQVPNVCILMDYCSKGSLADVLQNENIPINWPFRFSFATDIARAMAYLHSRKFYHGRLFSSNCVIDDRWTVKVTDYGFRTYRRSDRCAATDSVSSSKHRDVYLAPEFEGIDDHHPTPAGDVYSFAIILIEISSRDHPYGDEDPDNLTFTWKPQLPDLNDENSQDSCPSTEPYLALIQSCWTNEPSKRPSFQAVKRMLQRMNPNKTSAIDLMMNMMDKYSRHLEQLVDERTNELLLEKQKTERLLHSMLPKTIADQLRQGCSAKAECFPNCTIFFSDIVGFTALSGESTPMEIVNLLNKLYTCFDRVIDKYIVYKVETIGDAYMVAAGVPLMTPFHAREISDMSIHLMEASKNFVIPHRKTSPLVIRVGIHSGSVCAGVVGLKMPRYCLFGDTVNTASRMESTGEGYRIHVSEATHTKLETFSTYEFELRGTVQVKGKGDMKTWWLLGKTADSCIVKEETDSAEPVTSKLN